MKKTPAPVAAPHGEETRSADRRAGLVRSMAVWLALFLALVPAAFGQPGSFDWSTVPLLDAGYPGIKRAYVAVTSPRNMKINCLQIDTTVPGLRFYTTPAGSPPEVISQTTRQFISASRPTSRKLVAAINANPWYPYNSSEWNTPKSQNLTGLAVSEGVLVSPGGGTPSLLVDALGTAGMAWTYADQNITGIRTAVSGFGIYLSEGTPVPPSGGWSLETDLHPRTGIGLSQDGRYVYLMTIDGRQSASAGATTQELGSYLKWFGAWNGINMDGGGSTTMAWWNPGASSSQLLNVPVGQSTPWTVVGTERYNANNLGVYYAYNGAWWTGGSGAWSQPGAWQTAPTGGAAMTPTTADGLAFAQSTASPQAVTLGADRAARVISVSTADAVSLTGGGANRTLTLGPADTDEPYTLALGVSAGPLTIGSPKAGEQVAVALDGTQTWANSSANLLTVHNTVSRVASDTADRFLTLTGPGNMAVGTISDGGTSGRLGLAKSGAGTVTLTGSNTYSGPTTITGGRLAASMLADHRLSAQSVVGISGGALDLAGRRQTIAGLTGNGGQVLSDARNFSFENPAVGAVPPSGSSAEWGYWVCNDGGSPRLPDWNYPTWANIRVLNSDYPGGSQAVTGGDGAQYLELLTWAPGGNTINQTLPGTIRPGTYTLTVATGYGTSLAWAIADSRFSLRAWDGATFTDLGTTIVDLPGRYGNWRWNLEGPKQAQRELDDFTLTVVVPADSPHIGKQLDVRLFSSYAGPQWDSVAFDNVRLDHVPESAAAITVNQSSFESPDAAGFPIRNIMNNGPLDGWNPHPWAWSQYVVENGGLTLSGVTGSQFLMLDPATDGYGGATWSFVHQNTGAKFSAGTYTLTVDAGYATGWIDRGKDSTFTMQLVADSGGGNWTGIGATTISAATLAAHDGSLATYTHTLNVTGNEAWIGQDVVIFLHAASPYQRGSAQAESYWQNVSLDNVRLDFVAAAGGGSHGALTLNVAGGQTHDFGGLLGSDVAALADFSLVKSGAGTQILSGSNNYSAGTTLNAGVLRLDHANAAGPGAITQTTDASTLQINTAGPVANAMSLRNISILQSVTLNGAKTLDNTTYTVASGATATESGILSGTGGLTKQGAGTLAIEGNSFCTGNIAVAEGTLRLTPAGSMRFTVGASGVNTSVGGAGAFVAEGTFHIDLTSAGTAPGDSWPLVAASSKSFAGTFTVAGFTESPSGTWTRRANGVDYVFSEAAGTLSVPSGAGPYDVWASGHGLDPATNGAWEADPDGDSLPNSAEYAFGTSPVAGNSTPTRISPSGGNLVISWLQRTDGAMTYTVEESPDLSEGSWVVSSAIVQAGSGPAGPAGYEWKQITVPATGGKRFFRLAAGTLLQGSYLLEPNYRGWMYGGWPSALRLKILVEDHASPLRKEDLQLEASLAAAGGAEVFAATRDVTANQIDWALAKPGNLGPGDYLLRVRLVDRRNGKVLAGHEHPLVQWSGQSPSARCWIDRHQRLIVDGQPFFPLGMYAGFPSETDLQAIAEAGFNCVMPYFLYGQTGQTIEAQKKYLADSERLGVKTIYSTKDIYQDWAINHLAQLHGWPADKNTILTRLVETHRDDPNIIAWYINDEMGVADVPKIKEHYRLTQSLDPSRPIWMCDYRPEVIREFWDTSDVFGVNRYPIAWLPIWTAGHAAAQGHSQMFSARPMWHVPQAHNLQIYNPAATDARPPSYLEMRNMAYQKLASGGTGLIFYNYDDLKADPDAAYEERYADVKRVGREFRDLIPVLLSVEEPLPVNVGGGPELRWFCRFHNNVTHVFLVNTVWADTTATLTVPRPGLQVTVDGVALGQSGPSGSLPPITLPPYGVRRVEITP